MYQNHTFMVCFCIEKLGEVLYDGIIKYYDVEAHMKKSYEEMVLNICILEEEIVRTSTLDDPFNDDYKDPNIFSN